jgi:hypothetical protein
MLRAEEFSVSAIQAIAFTPDSSTFQSSRVLSSVIGEFASRYDGDVQVIPLPDEIPPGVDRLVLKSADGEWLFAASLSRMVSVGDGPLRPLVPLKMLPANAPKYCRAILESSRKSDRIA